MAILTVIHTEILCLTCDRRVVTNWKSYMVCTHMLGVWKFIRIGVGADKVKAALCTICPTCFEGMTVTEDEDDISTIRRKAGSKILSDIVKNIERDNHIVIIATFEMVKNYLVKARPWIEVGHSVKASVQEPVQETKHVFSEGCWNGQEINTKQKEQENRPHKDA